MLLGAIQPLPPVRQLSMMLPRLLRRNSFMIACILALRNSLLPAGMRSSQKPNSRGVGTSGTPSGRLSELMEPLPLFGRCGGRSTVTSSSNGGGAGGRRALDLAVGRKRTPEISDALIGLVPAGGREEEVEVPAGLPADADGGGGGAEARARRPVDVRTAWRKVSADRRGADMDWRAE